MISNKILQSTVAKRLEILRKKRELTMSGLAERSGVSKGTLSVLEDGSGNPTISTLWSIADALEVPFSDLINIPPQNISPELNVDGMSLQLIDQTNENLRIEAYHMTIKANSHRESTPHPAGVKEQITVLQGHLLTGSVDSPKLISPGEHYTFDANCPHIYSAPTDNVSAIVTVQYPKDKRLSSEYTIVKSTPADQEEWDGLLTLIRRHSVEVANGLPVFRLLIRTGAEPEIVARNIEARVLSTQRENYKSPVSLYFSPEKEQLCLYIFPKSKGYTYSSTENNHSTAIEKEANKILAISKANDITLNNKQINFLSKIATTGNLLSATLASEALSIHAIPTLPHQIDDFIKLQHTVEIEQTESEEPLFEDRINVHSYNAYELLHPGYARQTLVAGKMLLKHGDGSNTILDMGTGPGLPLLMLLDLIPDLNVTAVEPSPTAFAYLKKNTEHLDIKLQCGDFLDLDSASKYSIITSTGASHHLNTGYFLQKAHALLEDDGILIIADEIIPSFNSEKERNQALINHHVSYMLDVISLITRENMGDFSPNGYDFILPYAQELPTIAFMAITNSIDAAISRLRLLRETMQKSDFETTENKMLLGYCSFLNLELEALLAGIDYEVERKTSVENFFALAESSGLNLLEHQRVYATFGKSKTEGGTHIFVFKKSL